MPYRLRFAHAAFPPPSFYIQLNTAASARTLFEAQLLQ